VQVNVTVKPGNHPLQQAGSPRLDTRSASISSILKAGRSPSVPKAALAAQAAVAGAEVAAAPAALARPTAQVDATAPMDAMAWTAALAAAAESPSSTIRQ